MEEEKSIWKGSPSQITNLWKYLGAGLLAIVIFIAGLYWNFLFYALLVPAAYVVWEVFVVRCRIFELTSQRLRLSEGVLSRRIDEIELYRVKDTSVEQPFWYRIFGLATLVITTSDRTHATVRIQAIPDAVDLREKVRALVEILRDKKRVREVDFEGGDTDDFDGGDTDFG